MVGALIMCLATAAGAATTTLVSKGSDGELPMCSDDEFCYSISPSMSDDGRFLAFSSTVQNIIPSPHTPTEMPQVLLHDRLHCTTVRLSQTAAGQPGDFPSTAPAISANGQVIAFGTRATNLVAAPGQSSSVTQIVVFDGSSGSLELISTSASGTAGDGSCAAVTVSADGRYVCFQSDASNLVRNDFNGQPDIFFFDRQSQTMHRIVGLAGAEPNGPSRRPHMTDSGRFVAFDSSATNLTTTDTGNLTQAYLYDRDADNNGAFDEPGETSLELVSVNSDGQVASNNVYWPVPAPDGIAVAFSTTASNLVASDTNNANDIFLRHLETSTTTRESVGPGGAQAPNSSWFPFRFSANGRYMTFHSPSQGLVGEPHNGMTHIFRRDLVTGENVIVSRNFKGELADQSSEWADISADGSFVAFGSAGNNMIPGGSSNPDWVNQYVYSFHDAHPFDCIGGTCLGDVVDSDTFQPPPDGQVDGADLAFLLGAWGRNPGSTADLVDSGTFQPPPDGVVDGADLAFMLGAWGSCE